MRKISILLTVLLLVNLGGQILYAVSSSQIVGKITDAATGEPLAGANVFLEGTAIGSASDLKGNYRIQKIPPGIYNLKIIYIGYKTDVVPVRLRIGMTERINVELTYDVVEGETVTITAQAEGQIAAINQQLQSNTIKNIVSAEKIMELPDANAAESVGRLPGVSILRDGGEASRVVIRGLSPKYNTITIGGEQIPATDLDNRSVDLNMISPEILAGIEVTKALTPDQDADAFGGTVNFKLADAPSGFRYNFRLQKGYNAHRKDASPYKGSFTLSNRFWNEKLGIMVTGNRERNQRGSDELSAGLVRVEGKLDKLTTNSVTLRYIDEVRMRTSFSLLMDYQLPNGKILLTNFLSRLDRDEDRYSNQYNIYMNNFYPSYRNRKRQVDVMSNSLTGEHRFDIFKFDWRLSRTGALTRHPFDSEYDFREEGAFPGSIFPNEKEIRPNHAITPELRDLDFIHMFAGQSETERSAERNLTGQVNLEIPYTFGNRLAGYLKLGGKYRDKTKNRDSNSRNLRIHNVDIDVFPRYHSQYGNPDFTYKYTSDVGYPSIYNYDDPNFDTGNFLNGDYDMVAMPNANELGRLFDLYAADSSYTTSYLADLDDYEVRESVSSAYVMTEINFGRIFMFMPGIRYEHTRADMTGRKGAVQDVLEKYIDVYRPVVTDTSAVRTYARWFPMFHFRVRPASWFDIRLAYTRTLSRPTLDWMMPTKRINSNRNFVTFGNPDIEPQVSTNYDVFLSLYGNRLGLLTFGGFYKEVDDLIYRRSERYIPDAAALGLPSELNGYFMTRPENNKDVTIVKGWEVEWQTNFHWLPSPLNGIVLNVNYTRLSSETQYPWSFLRKESLPTFPFVKNTMIDTFRTGGMLNQADNIVNVAIGYDKGPFSTRYSVYYQGQTLAGIADQKVDDSYVLDLLRMEVTVKYNLTRQIGLFLNFNNITNEPDEKFKLNIENPNDWPVYRQFYGWTADFGIAYVF